MTTQDERRGPGRPEVGPAFSLRFPEGLLDRVDAYAAQRNTTRAGALRVMAELHTTGARWVGKKVHVPMGMDCEGDAARVIGWVDRGVPALLLQVDAPGEDWHGQVVATTVGFLVDGEADRAGG